MLGLCRECLKIDPSRRPGDTSAIAAELTAIHAEVDDFNRLSEIDHARVVEKKRRRATMFCAISLVADIQEDAATARRWLEAVVATTDTAEVSIRGFGRSLDSNHRPDLAYRIVTRCLITFADWSERPEFGWQVDAAWFALRWAVGNDRVPPAAAELRLPEKAMCCLEADLDACQNSDPTAVRTWLEQVNGRQPTAEDVSWNFLFGQFPSLDDRWRQLENRIRALSCG